MRKIVYQALGGCLSSLRRGGEDIAFMSAINKHFPPVSTDFPSTQHYVKPNGSTEAFLKRTRVVGATFEFLEINSVEVDGTLAKVLLDYQSQADINVSALRALLSSTAAVSAERRQ